MNLTDIFRTFHPNAEEYTFFLSAHGILSRIDNILGQKSNLSKFEKIEIILSIFSNHNAMKLDINYKKKTVKSANKSGLKNTFLNNQQVTEEIKREIKEFLETNCNNTTQNLPVGCSKSSSKREVNSNTILPQETRKTSSRQPKFMSITPEKKQKAPKISRRK